MRYALLPFILQLLMLRTLFYGLGLLFRWAGDRLDDALGWFDRR